MAAVTNKIIMVVCGDVTSDITGGASGGVYWCIMGDTIQMVLLVILFVGGITDDASSDV